MYIEERDLLRRIPETTIFIVEKDEIGKQIKGHIFRYKYRLVSNFLAKKVSEDLEGEPITPKDLEGKFLIDIYPHLHDTIRKREKKYDIQLENKTDDEYPQKYTDQHGNTSTLWVHTEALTIKTDEKIIDIIYGSGKDITELLEAKTDTEVAHAKLNQFISHVVHDIKNPAGAITGFGDLASSKLNEVLKHISKDDKAYQIVEKIQGYVDNILIAGNRVLAFANDLNEFQKLKSGKLHVDIEAIRSQFFFETLCNQQRAYLENLNKEARKQDKPIKDISLILDESMQAKIPSLIWSDARLLERIFTNLVGNAIKFTDQGQIKISCTGVSQRDTTGPKYYRFAIGDTGIGIDPIYHESIFKEFEQAKSTYTSPEKGSGLGLCIVTQIIGTLGGKMLPVESQIGKGSTFSFELPLSGLL